MSKIQEAFSRYQRSAYLFSRDIIGLPLYRYQVEIADAILRLVAEQQTSDIVVEMSRQSGKNEVSAQTETILLAINGQRGGTMVKTAPTWSPQIVRSKHRLEARARAVERKLPFLHFKGREGYIVQCGEAAINLLSGRPTANVIGDTASLLLEVDEAQDFSIEKYDKEFAPMRASTGAPAVFYGTSWTDVTLLEQIKTGISEGRVAGRIFRVPWERVAEENPRYGEFVSREIERLGADHPLIRTQYKLDTIEEQGRFLRREHLRLMMGTHRRAERRTGEAVVVAGLDFAGADEEAGEMVSLHDRSGRDSVALSIGRVEMVRIAEGIIEPMVHLLARYEWVNVPPATLHGALYRLLGEEWRVELLHADATGIGEVSTAYLSRALRETTRTVAIKFDGTWSTHTRLAFQYLAMAQGGRLRDYRAEGEGDPLQWANQDIAPKHNVDAHAWWQRGQARLETRPGKRVRAYVPDNRGHDDILSSEMLLVDAAYHVREKPAGPRSYSLVTM